MRNAHTAALNFFHRYRAFFNKGPQDARVEAGPGLGEPDVTSDGKRVEMRLYAYIESAMTCEMWGLPGSIAVSDIGFARALDRAKAHKLPIVLRLNSGGGDVFAGVAIATLVREAKLPVFIDGNAASIATVIAAASPHVTMSPGSTQMFHNPWSCVCGNARAMRAEAKTLDTLRDAMLDIYVSKSAGKMDLDEWESALYGEDGADGTWMTASECVAAGVCDSAPNAADDEAGTDATIVERRQMLAEMHGVALPKNLATLPGRATEQKPQESPAPGQAPAAVMAPSARVSHRKGAFYIPKS